MLNNCRDLVIDQVTKVKFLDLVKSCKAIDESADPMKVSQLISDLVAERKILPVFFHPVTKQYKPLPHQYIKMLNEAEPEKFRRLYTKLKKNHSAAIAYQYEKLQGLSKSGLAAPIADPGKVEYYPVEPEKPRWSIITWLTRLFSPLKNR